jgi:hypothetical protein
MPTAFGCVRFTSAAQPALQDAIYAGRSACIGPNCWCNPKTSPQVVVSVLALRQTAEVTEIHLRPTKNQMTRPYRPPRIWSIGRLLNNLIQHLIRELHPRHWPGYIRSIGFQSVEPEVVTHTAR